MKKVLSILFFGFTLLSSAQQKELDSLRHELKKFDNKPGITNDTLQYKILLSIGRVYQVYYPDSAMPWHVRAENLARKWNQPLLICNALRQEAWNNNLVGNYQEAQKTINRAMKLIDLELKKDPKSVKALRQKALLLCNTGSIYDNLSNYPKALDYYFKSLRLAEQLNDKVIMGMAYTDIGIVYDYQQMYDQALVYYQKALKIDQDLNDPQAIADDYLNIGVVYNNVKKYNESLEAFQQALKTYQTSGLTIGKLKAMLNIALTYNDLGKYDLAIKYCKEVLSEYTAMGDKRGQAMALSNLANVYTYSKDYNNAIQYRKQGLKLVEEMGAQDMLQSAHHALSEDYDKLNRKAEAFYHYKQYIVYRDSVFNIENARAITEKEMRFNFDKKAASDSISHSKENEIRKAEIARQNAEIKAKQNQQYALIGGLSLLVVFAVFMYNRYRVTQKQKHIIEEQKKLVEHAHKEITDSINYAERIQRSFMATQSMLDENLDDYFVLFKPKDVVSGDFYWCEKLSNGNFLLAAADSTGHGVPGAIMSLLNITSLENAVKEGLTHPAEILNHSRSSIIARLKKDGSAEGGKDGMDCSLLSFDFENNQLNFALANNPLWLVRNNDLVEYNADRMPVGRHDKQDVSFSLQTITPQKGDLVYVFTDGYADQFGGEKGKKFKYSSLKQLLLQISNKPMQEQKTLLDERFEQWRGGHEQIDDICIIGIRI